MENRHTKSRGGPRFRGGDVIPVKAGIAPPSRHRWAKAPPTNLLFVCFSVLIPGCENPSPSLFSDAPAAKVTSVEREALEVVQEALARAEEISRQTREAAGQSVEAAVT